MTATTSQGSNTPGITTPCTHPPARLYTWTAHDVAHGEYVPVRVVACCQCGDVLTGAAIETVRDVQGETIDTIRTVRSPTYQKQLPYAQTHAADTTSEQPLPNRHTEPPRHSHTGGTAA